jgi:hypothetical protein
MRNYNSEKEDRALATNKKRVVETVEPAGSFKRIVDNNSDEDEV